MSIFCKIEDLNNESDVEQKFLTPLLTSEYPVGLGYNSADYRTKTDIRKIIIEKGKSKKLYVPDFIVTTNGIPFLVVEAKNPSENLQEAIREARLYAAEINARYKTGLNPCSKIIVSNGKETYCNYWDQDDLTIKLEFSDINESSPLFEELLNFASKKSNLAKWEVESKKIRGGSEYLRPINMLGGKNIREEEYPNNGFGEGLVFKYKDLFNPDSYDDKKLIAENAYIKSKTTLNNQKFIGRIIRAAKPKSMTDAREICDSDNPEEIFDILKQPGKCKGQIMLLIGNVGSGKSTFTVHTKEVALPEDLKEATLWISLDLNNAPLSKEEIYKWIKNSIISEIKLKNNGINFDDPEFIKKIYGHEIYRIREKLKAFQATDATINDEVVKKILELEGDLDYNVKEYINYFCNCRGKLLIVTLDNCDKRGRDTQLLMFEVASWMKTEYSCLIFFPIRDITYDHHAKEPPLDTVIKDMTFRIEPPPLQDVLYQRVKFAIGYDRDPLVFNLQNGMRATYENKDQGSFFKCMLKSLFNDRFFNRMISGLAGRDIRRGLEIFLNFCRSGYIKEEYYFKIITLNGEFFLPYHLIMRVLIRGNRKYYIDDNSNIKNLFKSDPGEEIIPDPYLRLAILNWLENKSHSVGPNGTKGFHKISSLLADLIVFGHEERRTIIEIKKLIRARLITSESFVIDESDNDDQNLEKTDKEELIALAPAGYIHLELLSNIEYLSSCSEDFWFKKQETAERIRERLVKMGANRLSAIDNSDDLISYLEEYRDFFDFKPEIYLDDSAVKNLTDLEPSKKAIKEAREKFGPSNDSYKTGEKLKGSIIKRLPRGFIVALSDAIGFLPVSDLQQEKLVNTVEIEVEIVKYDKLRKKYLFKI